MGIEEQVTSFEVSVRLMDLGVKQESQFHWISTLGGFEIVYHGKGLGGKSISAFTVAELGIRIPGKYLKEIWKSPNGHFRLPGKYNLIGNLSFTEADARGNMLIYLVEHKLIDMRVKQ